MRFLRRWLGGMVGLVVGATSVSYVGGAAASPTATTEGAAPGDTAIAMVSLHDPAVEQPPSWDAKLQVLVEPAAGRIQVGDTVAWDGKFVHVTLGHRDPAGDCVRDRLVVVSNGQPDSLEGVYDADLEQVPVVEEFPPVPEPGDVTRLAIAPFPGVDCVDAAVHASADPRDAGEPLRISRGARDLRSDLVVPVTAEARLSLDGWPERAAYDAEVTATARYAMTGSWSATAFRSPSVAGTLRLEVEPGDDATAVGPVAAEATDVDLWRDPDGELGFTVDLDTEAVFEATQPRVLLTVDGTTARSDPRRLPLSHPAPTDWSGTLAGRTWWRPTSFTVKGHRHVGFAIVRFLDEEWVYLEGGRFGFDGEAPATCTEADVEGTGCHRYYYDRDSDRLQIDDRRIFPLAEPEGWLVPVRRSGSVTPEPFFVDDVQGPARTGDRFRFTGTDGRTEVTLRRHGGYRIERGGETTRGRYRFLGGDRQLLRLAPAGGRVVTTPVLLFFRHVDGRRRLAGLDTDLFTVARDGF